MNEKQIELCQALEPDTISLINLSGNWRIMPEVIHISQKNLND